MTAESGIVIIAGVVFSVVLSFIGDFFNCRTFKKYTLEFCRFNEKLDMVKENMDQIAGPLLTSKVLFPDDEGFYYPEEEE